MVKVTFASVNDKEHHNGAVYTSCVTRLHKPDNLDMLTPTSTLVYGYKAGLGDQRFKAYKVITETEYTHGYAKLLKERSKEVRGFIDGLDSDVTICCFCPQGEFCHRRLLAKWFRSYREDLEIVLF